MLLRRLLLNSADFRRDPFLIYISGCPSGDVRNLTVAGLVLHVTSQIQIWRIPDSAVAHLRIHNWIL